MTRKGSQVQVLHGPPNFLYFAMVIECRIQHP
jgi:hypothetical protein